MKRILVTGNAGSGKSTLAKRIADQLGLPCHGLDTVVWQSGWRKTEVDERNRRIDELTAAEHWVIDGVSLRAQAKADTVVFLDVSRRTSVWRVSKRNWRYLFRSRPGLPANCPEILIIPTLLRIIRNFPIRVRPKILEEMATGPAGRRFLHLRTSAEVDEFVRSLGDLH